MLQRTNAICKIRRRQRNGMYNSDDVFADPSIQTWASREVSSTIIVQGSSQSTDRLCHFSCDIVNHLLGHKYATVFILNNADTREYFKRLGADELLRQISSQLLRAITVDMPIPFLVEILPRFRNASTPKEWFHIMELLMQELVSLFIVIDASVLQDQAKTADMWAAEFDAMFQRLPEKSTLCTKVMVLSNRKLDSSSNKILYVDVESISNKASRGKTSRPTPPRKRIVEGISREPSKVKPLNVTMVPGLQSLPFFIPRDTQDKLADDVSLLRIDQSSMAADVASSAHPTRPDYTQTSSREHQQRQEIGVAVICALSWEADAVEVLCDKIYDIHDFGIAAGDLNVYSVVQIGQHKVVILFMPAMGKSNAAASAVNCLHSFPNIRIALLTGICGGIPSPYTNAEIILGDVVVSDRLVVYDFGRQFPGGFRRKDTTMDNARKPLPRIAAFLSKLKTRSGSERLSRRMADHLEWLRHRSPHGDWAAYPGTASDMLYEATYHHKHHDGDCDECGSSARSVCEDARDSRCQSLHCDMLRTVSRNRLARQDHDALEMVKPAIHFGAYASGDIVMKSGEDRDEIGRREKVIAFEMEGAGIWDNSKQIPEPLVFSSSNSSSFFFFFSSLLPFSFPHSSFCPVFLSFVVFFFFFLFFAFLITDF